MAILDHPGELNIITRVLKRGRGRQRGGQRDVMLLVLKVEEGSHEPREVGDF